MTRKSALLVTGILCFLLVSSPATAAMGDVILSFRAEALNSTGLTWVNGYLWNVDHGHNVPAKLLKLDPSDGSVLFTLTIPVEHVMGLTWDGNSFWVVSHEDSYIYEIDPSTGSILSSFRSPNPGTVETGCEGLAWDGQYLWYADSDLDTIYQLDTSSGSSAGAIINSFSTPSSQAQGLAWDGSYLWHFDSGTNLIYKLNSIDGSIIISFPAPGHGEGDLAWEGGYLWISRNAADTIYKIDVGGGLPPVADAGPDQTVNLGDTVQFDGSASYDPDGTIVNYEWDFNISDGLWWETGAPPDAFGPNPIYVYGKNGVFIATLRVTDNNGSIDTDTCEIVVLIPPPLPPNLYINVSFDGNDVILYWDPPSNPDIEYYLIYRSTSQTGFDFNMVWVNTSSDYESGEPGPIPIRTMWNDTNAAFPCNVTNYEEQYYYTIRAVNILGEVSSTSRTVGKWTKVFPKGVSTFSLPLEPLENMTIDKCLNDMNAGYLKWMHPGLHKWMKHGDGGVNNTQMKLGEGYEVKFDNQTNYTFTGLPGAMISYDDNSGFLGFDPLTEARNLKVSVEPDGNVTLTWQKSASMGPWDWYEVYHSNMRDGFFGTPGIHYKLACPAINFGINTINITGLGANDPGSRLYFMVVPFNASGYRGASTYSIGVWTEEYQAQYDTFGIPLKLESNQQADWYCDNIPDTVGINYYIYSEQRWCWHSTRMPAGAYDVVLEMTEGYEISTSGPTRFTFIGV